MDINILKIFKTQKYLIFNYNNNFKRIIRKSYLT